MKKRAFLSAVKRTLYALLLTAVAAVLLCFPASVLVHKSIVSWEDGVYLLLPVWVISSFFGAMTLKAGGGKAIPPYAAVLLLSRLLVSLLAGTAWIRRSFCRKSPFLSGAFCRFSV